MSSPPLRSSSSSRTRSSSPDASGSRRLPNSTRSSAHSGRISALQSIAATERELRRAEDRPSVVSAATHAAQAAVPVTDPTAMEVAASIPETVPWSAAMAREPIAPVSRRAVGAAARGVRRRRARRPRAPGGRRTVVAIGDCTGRTRGPAGCAIATRDVACARRASSSGGSAGATTRAECGSAASPQRRVPDAPAGLGACHRRWPPRCRKRIRRRRAACRLAPTPRSPSGQGTLARSGWSSTARIWVCRGATVRSFPARLRSALARASTVRHRRT